LINSAKQKKFYNSFIKSWEITVENYYDRTGNLLGDGTDNGGTGSPDGKFDNVTGSTFSNSGGIDDILKRVGLTPPTTNTSISEVVFASFILVPVLSSQLKTAISQAFINLL